MLGITWDDSKPKPRRLFGSSMVAVSLLVAVGGPASAALPTGPSVQVIVERAAGSAPGQAESAVANLHGSPGRNLAIINSFSARVPESELGRLRLAPGVESVVPDAPVQMLSSVYEPTSDFGSVYNAQLRSGVGELHEAGLTGKGVTVALIDTGIVPVDGLRTAGKIIYGPDLSFESQAANLRNLDTYGHGTHMAGIIAGRDDAAVAPYTNPAHFAGVAPDARILSLKIGDARGATDASTMIAAIDWVVTHRNDNGMNVRVMNLSFGTDSSQYYVQDPISHAVENAWAKGIAVVAAAGNSGNGTSGLDNPARDPFVIAVGSVSYAAATNSGKQLQVRGKCISTLNDAVADWTPIVLNECATWNSNQRWNVQADGSVLHKNSGKCIDVSNAAIANGTSVILYTCNGGTNQKWTGTFAKTSQLKSSASGRCLDLREGLTAPGSRIQIWDCYVNNDNQRFVFPLGDDEVSSFSQGGDGGRNPDVLAPGTSIAGLRAPGSYVDMNYTSMAGTRFFRGSGTSQAAAFVSGLVALQYERSPNATPDAIKAELKRLAVPLTNPDPRLHGSGTLDAAKLLTFGFPTAPAQPFNKALGYGNSNPLQLSRGSMQLSMDNVVLSGEKDIFGRPFDARAIASARATGSTWSGGNWNGSTWSGSTWSGSTWSGSTWSGSTWSGSRWTTHLFSANVWSGSRWTGSTWSGSTWSGSRWTGSTWSSNTIWGK